jgi:hypothetical protein
MGFFNLISQPRSQNWGDAVEGCSSRDLTSPPILMLDRRVILLWQEVQTERKLFKS